MSPDPNTPGDGENGSGWFPLILAIVHFSNRLVPRRP
jgi:hypothetical protein